jgi:hypothetical protein
MAAAKPLRYPRPYGPLEQHAYTVTLMEKALLAAGLHADVQPSTKAMVQGRWLRELALEDGEVDVGWSVFGAHLGPALRVVPLPLCRGLFGWRLLMVRPADRERWASARTLADLQSTRFAQSGDWVDSAILRANGLRVREASSIDLLYDMVTSGRADALPRAAAELSWEQELRGPSLVLEPHLLLRYTAPLVFVVPVKRIELAAALQTGLERLQDSGQFERIFREHLYPDLRPWNLKQRRVLSLRNPWLPPGLPPLHSNWWLQPNWID